jgi:hypothetical protein
LAEFHPVPLDRPPRRSWLSAFGSLVAIVLVLAVVKPWGERAAPAPTPAATPGVSARPVLTARPVRDTYDPRLFGSREPDPAWELWPAGYVVEFGLAGPLVVAGQDGTGETGAPEPSGRPNGTPVSPPGSDGSPFPGPSAAGSAGPVVDLGAADHLIALGINTPADVRVVEIDLWLQRGEACCDEPVAIVRLPTLWDSQHFLVIGIADPELPGETGPWIPGEYRLDLVTIAAEVRSVRLRVSPPAN